MQGLDAYEEEHTRRIQVVHSSQVVPIIANKCQILVTKVVTRCHSIWHWAYPEFHSEFLRSVYLSKEECDVAVRTGVFFFEGRRVDNVPIGRDAGVSYISKGKTDDDGSCYNEPKPFVSGNTTFSQHMEETLLFIRLEQIEGKRDLKHDIVVFDDVRATLSKGYILAPTHALYWDTKTEFTCDKGLLQSYDGDAQIRKVNSASGSYDDSIVMVAPDEGKEIFAGFKLVDKIVLCNRTTFVTNVPDTFLYIIPYNGDRLPLAKFGNSRFTKVETIQMLTGNSAMQFQNSLDMYGGFQSMAQGLCRVERATIQNKLDHIASGGKYGFTKEYGPGHKITVAGSVAFVAKCEEREATLATFRNCTREIPIRLGPNVTSSQVLFADPITYNIVHFPTIVPCDSVMPQKWVMNGAWYCNFGEGSMLCPAPTTLDPLTNIRGIPELATTRRTGLFTETQLVQHALALVMHGSKDAVLAEMVAAAVTGRVTHPDGKVTFGVPLPDYQVEEMDNNFLWEYFSWVYFFGKTCSDIMYVCVALRILKWVIDTGLLVRKGWKKHGKIGRWMLGLFLNSFYDLIMTTKNNQGNNSNITEEGRAERPRPLTRHEAKPWWARQVGVNETAATSLRFETRVDVE